MPLARPQPTAWLLVSIVIFVTGLLFISVDQYGPLLPITLAFLIAVWKTACERAAPESLVTLSPISSRMEFASALLLTLSIGLLPVMLVVFLLWNSDFDPEVTMTLITRQHSYISNGRRTQDENKNSYSEINGISALGQLQTGSILAGKTDFQHERK